MATTILTQNATSATIQANTSAGSQTVSPLAAGKETVSFDLDANTAYKIQVSTSDVDGSTVIGVFKNN